jgi:branched-chain amino acid transport system ATP-binding protein
MLELINVHTYYEETHILNAVSLKVSTGAVVSILGRNGMGKSTTVHSIIGFTPPRSGAIFFRGEEITSLPPYKICWLGLALVPQGRRIFPTLSVKENLTLGARKTKRSDTWTLERIYSLFPVLKERSGEKGNLLSGGEQQMLSIARALLTNPDFLLMDEPSEGLAPIIVERITNIISQLKKERLSILLVEQNLPMALEISDFIYILNKGEVVYESTPMDLRDNKEVQNKYLAIGKTDGDFQ